MAELKGKKVIIEPNAPSEGLLVAFIEVNNAPVELMEYNKETSSTKPEQLNRSKQTDPQAS